MIRLSIAAVAAALTVCWAGPGRAEVPGIAAGHRHDVGLEKDSEVLFACGFEGTGLPVVDYGKPGGLFDLNGYPEQMHLTKAEHAVGEQCLELVQPKDVISPQWFHLTFRGQDTVYVRFYRKFEESWAWPVLGAHDTLLFAGKYDSPAAADLALYLDISQGPTQRTDKGGWDLERQPELVLKSSFQGPGLDFGLGKEIVSHVGWDNYYSLPYNVRPAPNLEGGRWYCFEYMAKMNTPGKADGEIRLWVDGQLTTEAKGLVLRNASHSQIKWDRWMLGPRYGGKDWAGSPKEQRSWFDALVIATSYIGPAAR